MLGTATITDRALKIINDERYTEVRSRPVSEKKPVEEAGPALHLFKLGFHQGGELADVVLGEVGDRPSQVGPYRLGPEPSGDHSWGGGVNWPAGDR
jgi:hypothetical protein